MKRASMIRLFNNENLSPGAAAYSDSIDIFTLTGWYAKRISNLNGYYCLEIKTAGDGVLTVEYESSLSGESFMVPEGESPLLEDFTSTNGANGDGRTIFQFSPHFAKHIRLKLTETGQTDAAIVSAYLGIL